MDLVSRFINSVCSFLKMEKEFNIDNTSFELSSYLLQKTIMCSTCLWSRELLEI